ncbi:hypothetical protein NBRC111894_3940 [Sporolactobacillus inulinus]|uniref:Uncharacterized protein n=1 Tax=Sporolactobacillus inulinus TaxID=2078 RepID=A0A4Y1ZGS1_9BACL|nr:TIGR04086 family membrane protein [Sporolactobacillus inulinus]GAY78386.1 hypothetical protein NBRC111894_3940 [Sporolactobacillus inulinus]
MSRNWLSAVTYGMIAAIVIVLASAFLLASLLRFTSFAESNGSILPIVISLVALFVGGVIAGAKSKEKGLLIGTITGLAYCLFNIFFNISGWIRRLASINTCFWSLTSLPRHLVVRSVSTCLLRNTESVYV